ncbi:MAG: diguanylate cyclase [Gemmatimonadaceae bacterium]|nr:diguanylate cyclase [Gemmatimonadaceae bacterium]
MPPEGVASTDNGSTPPRAEERPARILIVDDHEDNVDLLQTRLEAWGYRTSTASDGDIALRMIEQDPPDLVLLDVMMPTIDGTEVARRVKENKSLPFIPIIMQTALDAPEHKVAGLGAGADDYITKPIEFAELGARVKAMLRIKRLQEELENRTTELARLNQQLLYVSQTDGLTGLRNRRYIEERLHEMFEHSMRLNEPLSCVMCDLDKFKSVNDTYGHQAGDAVLRQFARILEAEAREIDKIGRYGGEEFIILLPGTVLDAGVTFAERVRKAVEEHTFTFDGGSLKRTASFGVAGWPHPAISHYEMLVKTADDALYVAKETGRNKVVRFASDEFNAHLETDGATADADVTSSALSPALGDRPARGEDRGAPAGA